MYVLLLQLLKDLEGERERWGLPKLTPITTTWGCLVFRRVLFGTNTKLTHMFGSLVLV
jgi:hypothetical protein